MAEGFKVQFHWREWWQAEGDGVIYASALCIAIIAGGVFVGITEGSWFLVPYGLLLAAWFAFYCGGWQLLMLGILKLRAKLGLISFRGEDSRDQ